MRSDGCRRFARSLAANAGLIFLSTLLLSGCGKSSSDRVVPGVDAAPADAHAIANDLDPTNLGGEESLLDQGGEDKFASAPAIQSKPEELQHGSNFLSDLTWESARNDYGPVERDQSVGSTRANDGNRPLIINGASYTKGLGVHGESEVVYALADRCSRFRAVIGINDYKGSFALGGRGSMRFEVAVDNVVRFQSDVVTGNTPAQAIDLPIAGAQQLRLTTRNNGRPGSSTDSNYDHGNWADARIDCTDASDPAPEPPPTWTRCGAEGEFCSFTGTRRVRYGANGTWVVREVTAQNGGVACNNAIFGDPLPGQWKWCEIADPTTTPPPPPPPPPALPSIGSFSASPQTIVAGQSVTLSWSVSNAQSVSIAPGLGTQTGSSVVVRPATNTTYTLTATNAAGASTSQATVLIQPAPQPEPTDPAGPITDADAARFLIQSTYGPNISEIQRVKQLGYEAWINEQFDTARIDTHQAYLARRGPVGCNPCNSQYINAIMESFWYQAVRSPDQLRQRTVLALSEIFVVSALNSNGALEIVADAHGGYHDMLARNAFGNFRQLLQDVATSPAMAHYLSHFKNEKEDPVTGRQPDENFAREIMQLFAIGLWQLNPDGSQRLDANRDPIPTYTRFDVEGLAKVFTGWGFGGNHDWYTHPQTASAWYPQMRLYPEHHSTSEKRIIDGVVIPAGTSGTQSLRIALDTLFNHPNVGPFIGSQLIKRFVTSNPSPEYIRRVTLAFNNNGRGVRGDMRAVLRAVLLDPEARSTSQLNDPTWGKLREPMVRFGNFMRAFNVNSQSGYFRMWNLEDPVSSLGQNPMRAPSVFNWFRPDYSPQGAVREAGLIAPEFQIVHEGTITSWVNFMASNADGRLPVDGQDTRDRLVPNYTSELGLAGNASQLVDRLNLLLAAGQLSPSTRTTIVDAVNSINGTTEAGRRSRLTAAITLVMSSPEYLIQK